MRKINDIGEILAGAITIMRGYALNAEIEHADKRLGTRNVDAFIRMGKAGRETLLIAEVKPVMTQAHLAQAIENRGRHKETILIARYAPPKIAEQLRANHVPYLDLAGNAWIPGPDFLLWVEGRKPAKEPRDADAAQTFNPAGLQVLFALLTNPDWVALTTRQLAEKIGLANGTVAATLRGLEAQGFVIRATRRGKRRMRNLRVLLDKWTEGYLQRLQVRHLHGYYRAREPNAAWWKEIDPTRHQAVLGGEPAAAELTGFLTPGQLTFYAERQPVMLIADHKLERDPGGNVAIRKKFWRFEVPAWNNDRFAPPLLIYADLMGTGDARCIEAAVKIREQYLARLLED